MSAHSHTSWTVTCDGPGPCPRQYGPDSVVAAVLRKRAKRDGWAVNVVNPEPGGYPRRLDFCPVHLPAPKEG